MPDQTLPDSVLLVDDEQSVLDVLTVAFARGKVRVRTALTAEEALVALDSERFGALVTDKNLPGKSGLDLIKEAKVKQPHIAAVMITGYVSTDSVLEALRLGANDYILKPFNDLMLMVERVKQVIVYQRTAHERALLADSLRKAERSLRKSETEAFQHRTELDLWQNVMELRIEEAVRALTVRVAVLEQDVEAAKEQTRNLRRTLKDLAAQCTDAQKTIRPTDQAAADALAQVAVQLLREADRES